MTSIMEDIDVFTMIESNLDDTNKRFMKIFVPTSIVADALIKVVKSKTKDGKFEYLCGTSNIDDQLSMISKIPILMKNGYTLILQRLEFLYASLYEVFNQAYKDITTTSRYCNIQIAGTKQLCKVHEDFKVIILQSQDENIFDKYDQNIEKQLPAPMLNRFEKQVILKGDIMSQSDLNCKSIIEEKLRRPFLSETGKNGLRLESVIANYSDETLCSI